MGDRFLEVSGGHRLAWHEVGAGHPVVVLHGGPGSGRGRSAPGWFDPALWRGVFFDQRGCGASRPHAGAPEADLSTNTTAHLIDDIEALRRAVGVERWAVAGGSWGATLALAYAMAHPVRVTGLLLGPVTMSSRAEIDWIIEGARVFFPAAHADLRAAVPGAASGGLARAVARRLASPDPGIHQPAADAWCAWERALVADDGPPHPRWSDPVFRLCFARLVTHYFAHGAFLEPGALRNGVHRLRAIPVELVHGTRDMSSPPGPVWELAQGWREANLTLVDGAGHVARGAGADGARHLPVAGPGTGPEADHEADPEVGVGTISPGMGPGNGSRISPGTGPATGRPRAGVDTGSGDVAGAGPGRASALALALSAAAERLRQRIEMSAPA